MSRTPDLGEYVEVKDRIAEFYRRYPDGRLVMEPPEVIRFGEVTFLLGRALAYQTPQDPRPAVGTAWEPVPGRTPYTRGSEVMNLETSAWGRALAALGIGLERSVASRTEVAGAEERGRAYDRPPEADRPWTDKQRGMAFGLLRKAGITDPDGQRARITAVTDCSSSPSPTTGSPTPIRLR